MTAASWALLSIALALCAVLASLRARRYADQAVEHAADATRHAADATRHAKRAVGILRTADSAAIERQTRALQDRVPDIRCPGRKCKQAKDCTTPQVCRVYFLGRSHSAAGKVDQ